jgi:hypothetical protein
MCLLWENGSLSRENVTWLEAVPNELSIQKERQTYKKNMLQNPLKVDRMKVAFNFEQRV